MLIIPDPQIDFQIPNLWQRLCIYTYGTPVALWGGGLSSTTTRGQQLALISTVTSEGRASLTHLIGGLEGYISSL